MKEIGTKLSSHDLYFAFKKLCIDFGVGEHEAVNMKAKNNSFFHRYRVRINLIQDIIEKGLEQQRKSDKQQD